jgi:hypothetical protein
VRRDHRFRGLEGGLARSPVHDQDREIGGVAPMRLEWSWSPRPGIQT